MGAVYVPVEMSKCPPGLIGASSQGMTSPSLILMLPVLRVARNSVPTVKTENRRVAFGG